MPGVTELRWLMTVAFSRATASATVVSTSGQRGGSRCATSLVSIRHVNRGGATTSRTSGPRRGRGRQQTSDGGSPSAGARPATARTAAAGSPRLEVDRQRRDDATAPASTNISPASPSTTPRRTIGRARATWPLPPVAPTLSSSGPRWLRLRSQAVRSFTASAAAIALRLPATYAADRQRRCPGQQGTGRAAGTPR